MSKASLSFAHKTLFIFLFEKKRHLNNLTLSGQIHKRKWLAQNKIGLAMLLEEMFLSKMIRGFEREGCLQTKVYIFSGFMWNHCLRLSCYGHLQFKFLNQHSECTELKTFHHNRKAPDSNR